MSSNQNTLHLQDNKAGAESTYQSNQCPPVPMALTLLSVAALEPESSLFQIFGKPGTWTPAK